MIAPQSLEVKYSHACWSSFYGFSSKIWMVCPSILSLQLYCHSWPVKTMNNQNKLGRNPKQLRLCTLTNSSQSITDVVESYDIGKQVQLLIGEKPINQH